MPLTLNDIRLLAALAHGHVQSRPLALGEPSPQCRERVARLVDEIEALRGQMDGEAPLRLVVEENDADAS